MCPISNSSKITSQDPTSQACLCPTSNNSSNKCSNKCSISPNPTNLQGLHPFSSLISSSSFSNNSNKTTRPQPTNHSPYLCKTSSQFSYSKTISQIPINQQCRCQCQWGFRTTSISRMGLGGLTPRCSQCTWIIIPISSSSFL